VFSFLLQSLSSSVSVGVFSFPSRHRPYLDSRLPARHLPTHPGQISHIFVTEVGGTKYIDTSSSVSAAIMASALLNSFKSSTAAISSRSLTRTAPRRLPAVFHTSRRYYSEDKSANDASEQGKEEKKKEDGKSESNCAETTEKLKTKEAEVVDLTVSVVRSPLLILSVLNKITCRVVCDTFRQTLLTFSATRHARRSRHATMLLANLRLTSLRQSMFSPLRSSLCLRGLSRRIHQNLSRRAPLSISTTSTLELK